MKHIEVEVKYALPDPASLIERLAELDAVPLGEDRQVDTYFNAPHRDFLAGEIVSEWLRLRAETGDHSADRASINFKRWLPLDASGRPLAYEGEREMAGKALTRLEEDV